MLTSMILSFAMSAAEPAEQPALNEQNPITIEQAGRKGIRIDAKSEQAGRKGIRIGRKGIRIDSKGEEAGRKGIRIGRKGIRI